MSRKKKARRKARRLRANRIVDKPQAPQRAKLTDVELARVLSRFRSLKGKSGFEFGFIPIPNGWVTASSPEELEEATRRKMALMLAKSLKN